MKFKLTLISLLITLFSVHAQSTEFQYKLGSKLKTINTFSGDINQGSSIHCIIFKDKNSKKHGIKPFYITEQDSIITLNAISFLSEPSVLSFHKNGNELTIIISQTDSEVDQHTNKISILDIDINTKEVKQKEIKNLRNPEIKIKLANKSILVYYSVSTKSMSSISIKNASDIIKTSYTFPKEHTSHFNDMFSSSTDFINTNTYIENGSISDTKVYYDNDLLVFDHINMNKKSIISLALNPKENTSAEFKVHKNLDPEKIKNMNSFYHQGNLFVLIKTKEKTKLVIIDPKTGTIKKSASLQDDYPEYLNSRSLKIIDEQIKKLAQKPTITINKSTKNYNIIRISYVQKESYKYNSHWLFSDQMMNHQQFIIQQQQMMQKQWSQQQMNRMRPSGFGPHMPKDYFNIKTQTKTEADIFIKLVLDNEHNPIENINAKTIYKDIDEDLYIKYISKESETKHLSAAFTEKSMRAIMYSKKTKKFILKTAKIR